MTKQEYYEKLQAAVRDGVVPARRGAHCRCLYRGDNGTRCAIGLLIPDDKYWAGMENSRVDRLMQTHPDSLEPVDGMSPQDYRKVQAAHDTLVNFLDSVGGRVSHVPWSGERFLAAAREALGLP